MGVFWTLGGIDGTDRDRGEKMPRRRTATISCSTRMACFCLSPGPARDPGASNIAMAARKSCSPSANIRRSRSQPRASSATRPQRAARGQGSCHRGAKAQAGAHRRVQHELQVRRRDLGTVTSFATAIEDPGNLRKSRSVGAWLGLTPNATSQAKWITMATSQGAATPDWASHDAQTGSKVMRQDDPITKPCCSRS